MIYLRAVLPRREVSLSDIIVTPEPLLDIVIDVDFRGYANSIIFGCFITDVIEGTGAEYKFKRFDDGPNEKMNVLKKGREHVNL